MDLTTEAIIITPHSLTVIETDSVLIINYLAVKGIRGFEHYTWDMIVKEYIGDFLYIL